MLNKTTHLCLMSMQKMSMISLFLRCLCLPMVFIISMFAHVVYNVYVCLPMMFIVPMYTYGIYMYAHGIYDVYVYYNFLIFMYSHGFIMSMHANGVYDVYICPWCLSLYLPIVFMDSVYNF